ncbi:MAG: prolipoprotein diacylglyceryl transferase [Fimbriimonadaceae bacterium]|nr:prolipoprotein diacylglyceryl transferase [Fimbriimonadaceae bacterium]
MTPLQPRHTIRAMIYHHDLSKFLLGPWQVGPIHEFGIRWYSIAYIAGFLGIYASLFRAVQRRRIPNADLERLEEACLILITTVLLGARLGYFILNEPHKLLTWQGWLEVPQVWKGGMAFFGAAVAVFSVEYWYCRRWRVGFWHGSDRLVWVLAFALGFGRLANFINGELWGVPTGGGWGVVFPEAPLVNGLNVPRHPVQLYSAATHFLLGCWLLYLLRRRPRTSFDRVPGFTCFHFLAGYGLLRLVSDHWRPEAVNIGPLTGGQWLSLLMFLIAVACGRWRYVALRRYGGDLDWYPPEGVDGELPPECHTYIDELNVQRAAADEAQAAARRARREAR